MSKFIGNKKFYRLLLAILIPIVLQQLLTQFVNLLDNIMIGIVGNNEMTGVSIANQILFVYNLCVFGSLSGASIFATQYYGARNKEGYQESFRFKLMMGLIIFAVFTVIIIIFKEPLLNAFINTNEGDFTNPDVVLAEGKKYLMIMLVGNLFFALKEIYATSLREMRETLFPMICGIIAILVNLVFNYLLIYGKFGFPALGVSGAALATVLSRVVEFLIIVIYASVKKHKFDYLVGIFKRPIPKFSSIKLFLPKTVLLLSNEFFWSLGLTVIVSCYSLRGLDSMAALNIANTVCNLFITLGTALGNATGIVIGNLLGANKTLEAKEASYKILFFSFFVSLIFTASMIVSSFIIPNIYDTSEGIREVAKELIIIGACFLPIQAFNTCSYFILRAGGKVLLTIIFDSAYVWLIRLPLAFALASFTGLSIVWLYFLVNLTDVVKVLAGYILVDKGIWLKQIV
ncbi:MAG: MATE family efflux transporter [Bacilli bacterium]|nr:MATE family efflux transporter [Bacilli bacterium]